MNMGSRGGLKMEHELPRWSLTGHGQYRWCTGRTWTVDGVLTGHVVRTLTGHGQ